VRELDTDLIGNYGQTLVAVWPGPGYAVRRIALERWGNTVFLVVDLHVLDRFKLPALGAAWETFMDIDPLRLATMEDTTADVPWCL